MLQRVKNFLTEARQEFRHVNWPTRAEAIRLTTVVVALSVIIAVLLGFCDYIFTYALRVFILKIPG